jgi:hypothetical protein
MRLGEHLAGRPENEISTASRKENMIRTLGTTMLAAAVISAVLGRGQYELVVPAGPTRQVVVDGDATYVLSGSGEVKRWSGGHWTTLDTATRNVEIAASGGRLYVLRSDGTLYRYAFDGWNKLGCGISRITAAGPDLIVARQTGEDSRYRDEKWSHLVKDRAGIHQFTADEEGHLFALKTDKLIYRHGESEWVPLVYGGQASGIAAASGMLYVLEDTGHIWRFADGQWTQVDTGSNTQQIVADQGDLFALKTNGNVWMFRDGAWSMVDNGIHTREIDARGGTLAILKNNGATYQVDTSRLPAIARKIRAWQFLKDHVFGPEA